MAWTVVSIENKKPTKGVPTASIGFGRIALNVAACELVDDFNQYKFVELLTDSERPSVIAIRFLTEESKNSLPVRRRTSHGSARGGMDISSRFYVEKLFGIKGTQNKTTLYSVEKEADNILVINTN